MAPKSASSVDEPHEREVRQLPAQERLRLAQRILAEASGTPAGQGPRRSLRDLEGLGAEIWKGADAQAYIDSLRREWDHRP